MLAKLLVINACALLVFMTVAYVLAYSRRRLDTVDAAWGLGFILVAWISDLEHVSVRSFILAILVSVWGLRLTKHILTRAAHRGHEDPRYESLSQKWHRHVWLRAYVSVFLIQAVLIWLISLPIDLATNKALNLSWFTTLGVAFWLIGFITEATADHQLTRFLKDGQHPKVLDSGLWHYSRHPNYFGELLQWWAIGLIATQTVYGWIGLLGPLILSLLIIFVSGLPPIERRRAKDKEYQAYKRRTSPLIPLPPKQSA